MLECFWSRLLPLDGFRSCLYLLCGNVCNFYSNLAFWFRHSNHKKITTRWLHTLSRLACQKMPARTDDGLINASALFSFSAMFRTFTSKQEFWSSYLVSRAAMFDMPKFSCDSGCSDWWSVSNFAGFRHRKILKSSNDWSIESFFCYFVAYPFSVSLKNRMQWVLVCHHFVFAVMLLPTTYSLHSLF